MGSKGSVLIGLKRFRVRIGFSWAPLLTPQCRLEVVQLPSSWIASAYVGSHGQRTKGKLVVPNSPAGVLDDLSSSPNHLLLPRLPLHGAITMRFMKWCSLHVGVLQGVGSVCSQSHCFVNHCQNVKGVHGQMVHHLHHRHRQGHRRQEKVEVDVDLSAVKPKIWVLRRSIATRRPLKRMSGFVHQDPSRA